MKNNPLYMYFICVRAKVPLVVFFPRDENIACKGRQLHSDCYTSYDCSRCQKPLAFLYNVMLKKEADPSSFMDQEVTESEFGIICSWVWGEPLLGTENNFGHDNMGNTVLALLLFYRHSSKHIRQFSSSRQISWYRITGCRYSETCKRLVHIYPLL